MVDHHESSRVEDHLHHEIERVIERFRYEYELSYAQAVGVLQLMAFDLMREATDMLEDE